MSNWTPSPADLLAAARSVPGRGGEWGPSWPRATAVLARQALESALASVWTGDETAMADCTFTDQLVCLPHARRGVDPDVARQARHIWHALSGACHAHAYELSPTASELDTWLDDVTALVAALAPTNPASQSPGPP